VKPEALSAIRYAVCAIGWTGVTREEFEADSMGRRFEIEGTGFLVEPTVVQTCAHVIEGLERVRRKRGPRPYASAVQFFYPDPLAADEWTSAIRPFDVIHTDARIDVAILRLRKRVDMPPVKIVTEGYTPIVGEGIGLCGYAHGSMLMTRAGRIDRVGPLVQTGIIAAVSPFDVDKPDKILLDLVTGPAASGSPIFRLGVGDVIGFLMEGQIKGGAAFSIARLINRTSTGHATARLLKDIKVSKKQGDGT
jgi:Trypsin-like peptidase domain